MSTRKPGLKQMAIQGAPGTGKTRQLGGGLVALFARRYQSRRTEFKGKALPTWAYRLIRNSEANPFLGAAPRALPVAIITPMRVTTTWEREVIASYPGAEVMMIDRWQDVDEWMKRCQDSTAPAVVGVFSQSKTRAFSLEWSPAVIEKKRKVVRVVVELDEARRAFKGPRDKFYILPEYKPVVPKDAEEAEAVCAQLREQEGVNVHFLAAKSAALVMDGEGKEFELERTKKGDLIIHWLRNLRELKCIEENNKTVGWLDLERGEVITVQVTESHFFCPNCGERIEAVPDKARITEDAKKDGDEEDARMPVTSLTYFKKQQRSCEECGDALWQMERKDAGKARFPMPSFRDWSAAMEQLSRNGRLHELGFKPEKVGRGKNAPTATMRIARVQYKQDEDGFEVKGPDGRWIVTAIEFGVEAPSDFSPYDYAYMKYRGCIAVTVVDECHNARSRATDIGHAVHMLTLAAQRYVYASGTIYGGMLDGFYYQWFRFNPMFWKGLGLGWNDVEEAVRRYGVVQNIIKEHESDSRRGSGSKDITVSTVPAPGISAKLLPRLLEQMVFIDTLDVGAFLPEKVEFPEVVDMIDPAVEELRGDAKAAVEAAETALKEARALYEELVDDPGATAAEKAAADTDVQEAQNALDTAREQREQADQRAKMIDLASAYGAIEGELESMAKRMIQPAILAKGMMPRWWSALPCVSPAYEVTRTSRTEWGDVLGKEVLYRAPVLASDYIYPLEKRLREIVTNEVAEDRSVMIYIEQNEQRSAPDRLKMVLADFAPWVLPNNVDPEDREDAIRAAYDLGKRVLIVPYRRVSEGLNLQFLDTVVWFEMAQNLFHLEQSNLRIHRLGAKNQKRMYYLVYRGTVAHKKLVKLGSQSGALAVFSGNTPTGALVKQAGADKTTLARMSASLEAAQHEEEDISLVSDEELREQFRRRAQELNAALKKGREWVGVTDTLPERLAAIRALQAAQAAEAAVHAASMQPRVIAPAAKPVVKPVVPMQPAAKPVVPMQPAAKPVVPFVPMRKPATPAPVAVKPQAQPVVTPAPVAAKPAAKPVIPMPTSKVGTQFGNIDDIAAALRKQRKSGRDERKATAIATQTATRHVDLGL